MGTSFLKIGFPEYGNIFSLSAAGESQLINPIRGCYYGNRANRCRTASNALSVTWKYDFQGKDLEADFLYIARADLLVADNLAQVRLRYSDDDSSYTAAFTENVPLTLVGRFAQDWLKTFTLSDPHRYWEVYLSNSIAGRYPFSKLFFGKLFDMEAEPTADMREVRSVDRIGMLRSNNNMIRLTRIDVPKDTYEVKFENVSLAKALEFERITLLKYKKYCVLYDTSGSDILNGNICLHGVISNVTFEQRALNKVDVRFSFKEMSG